MVTNNVRLKLVVRHVSSLNDTCMSVFFVRPIGFDYEPGDWADINFYAGNPSGGTTYSFSSSPTEETLGITFKTGISPFKKRLQSLVPGDEMFISQYGNDYGFQLKENRSSVLIAGGIGIAPFRSMLKQIGDTGDKSEVQLLYINKEATFVFADEINCWQKQLPGLRVHYIDTSKLSRKRRRQLLTSLIDRNADHYFIAGPEGMVETTEHLLADDLGISPKDIRIDSFSGY